MSRFTRLLRLALAATAVLTCIAGHAQRTYGGMYTQDRLANTRANAQNVSWVTAKRTAAINNAAPWLAMSDEQLWSMVPAQSLPRCIDVTWDYDFPSQPTLGCLNCGSGITAYGNYPYNPDFKNKPWKLTCPNCKIVFPTNDFGAYYQSGINAKGEFDPAIANKGLLFNTAHPNPTDPLYKYGVDDGYGYVDANGRQHKFIGYYAWKYWRYIISGLSALSEAYVYTGDKQYARKAAIMLDRIADEYPAMDWKPYADLGWYHSDGGSHKGKIEGRIWENSTIQTLATCYDKIISGTVDNAPLYSFLQQKDTQFTLPGTKGTRADLINNIDTNLLQTGALAIQAQRIWGNEGMHQLSMACCAVSLNTEPKTTQWLDWDFAPAGGHLPTMLVQLFDRDGMANEAAPGYCYLWPGQIKAIMDILEPYPAYTHNRISRDFPWVSRAFTAPWRVQALNTFTPNIGDTGATGLIDIGISPSLMAPGFKFYNDDTAARYAWEANGNSASGLLLDVGSTTPDVMNHELEQVALAYPAMPRLGEHLAAYGLASVEFGENSAGKALWCYYGRNMGHGHQDRLNYGIYAFNTDLSPDLGYPEFASATWAPRAAWNNNTISHNCVSVDQAVQKQNWTGMPQFYAVAPGLGAFEVESRNVYTQTTEYARTMAFIQAPGGNAYAVDIFRVTGGKDHLLSFHGPPGPVTVSGGSFVPQATGTYAGPNVAYGDNSTAYPLGYSYLKNVSRATSPPSNMWIDWKAAAGYRGVKSTDNIHMRLQIATPLNDTALADGVPAQNKPGNPASIRYALLHRKAAAGATSIASQFITLAEPWRNSPFVTNLTRLDPADASMTDVVALRIDLAGGVTDYVISNPARKAVSVVNGPATNGAFAWVRTENGDVTSASLTRGSNLSFGTMTLTGQGNITGQLVRFEHDPTKPMCAWVVMSTGDAMAMKGSQIYFTNDNAQTACYDVIDVEPDGLQWKLTCGPGSFIRGFVSTSDYTRGYTYNISEGATFYAPVTTIRLGPNESGISGCLKY